MFKNRTDAGKQLAQELTNYKNKDVVVVAIPRGGLPLGAVVAKSLNAPLDVILTKKIGHPLNKEFAIGAVSIQNKYITESTDATLSYIEEETRRIRELLRQRENQYYKNLSPINLSSKIVIVVDDGIATGNTILATIALINEQKPSAIIVATPVAAPSALYKVKKSPYVDDVICLHEPSNFRAVGQFYIDFNSVPDERAIQILEETNRQLH